MTFDPRKPLNLTEIAERMPWSEARRVVRVLSHKDSPVAEIDAVNVTGEGHGSQGLYDEVWVVTSGYGALWRRDEVLQCTAGDLLFIPAGAPYRFERLDGDFRLWRIALGPEGSTHQD